MSKTWTTENLKDGAFAVVTADNVEVAKHVLEKELARVGLEQEINSEQLVPFVTSSRYARVYKPKGDTTAELTVAQLDEWVPKVDYDALLEKCKHTRFRLQRALSILNSRSGAVTEIPAVDNSYNKLALKCRLLELKLEEAKGGAGYGPAIAEYERLLEGYEKEAG